MSTNIGAISGLIELKDEFSSQLGVTEAVLSNFSKSTQKALTDVAVAGGLVTAAFGAVALATIELGKHGSEVNDISSTLEHFSGNATAAAVNLGALRAGVLGTVDDMTLAKNAAHLLSAGVKLTGDDFKTLGEAAFVLQNRGLGGTKEMLELVSDAMVTGRTRALSMALGVVDAGDAEQKLADRLGVTKDQLSDTGKVEAKRLQIMDMLKSAVKDAGTQERDFGEELEYGKTQLSNFINELSSSVAKSPAFANAFRVIEDAIKNTFSNDKEQLITDIVHGIEKVGVIAADVGLAAVEVARVFNVAWSAIKVGVLGTETVVMTFADMALSAFTAVANAIATVTDDAQVKKQAATIAATRDQIRGMSDDLSKQTAEAFAGIVGQSEFDKTLDKVGGTLFRVRDALNAASNETGKNTDVNAKAEDQAKKNKQSQEDFNKSLIDQGKIQQQLVKSTQELSAIWEDYFALVAKRTGTSQDAQRSQIEATFNKQVAALNALDPLYKAKYDAYRAIANESLTAIGSSWDSLKDKSIESMQQQANSALADYDRMLTGGLHFTRDVLDAQLKKYRDLQEAVRGFGQDAVAAHAAAAEAANKHSDELEAQKKKVDELAAANRAMGSTFTYDLSSKEGIDQYRKMNPAASVSWSDDQIMSYIKKGGTLQGLIQTGVINPYGAMGSSSSVSGFSTGGEGDFGAGTLAILHGRERITPLDELGNPRSINGQPATGSGVMLVQHYYVNGTGDQVYQIVKDRMMRDLKHSRQLGAA